MLIWEKRDLLGICASEMGVLHIFHPLKCLRDTIRATDVICKWLCNSACKRCTNDSSIPRFSMYSWFSMWAKSLWTNPVFSHYCLRSVCSACLEALLLHQTLPETFMNIPHFLTVLKLAWYFCTVLHHEITIKRSPHAPLAHALCHLCSDHSHIVSVKMSYKKGSQIGPTKKQ